ncbi:MAG TPA: MBL fold metallo-hydrolase [Methylomirabilota bacterium]|jgi:7,8-dihydropterin-6-yl-methyl-4-(beta-D-ribofuranosyl)aminobenzene 5'-phosphate synthase|nr:MBL fold metallo-hydrolase [Methylomirabilota bacterium]
MPLGEIDRISVTTVVDNSIDALRPDEKIARRHTLERSGRIPPLRAEHGLAHHVEVTRGSETMRIGFDFGLTAETMIHNFDLLDIDARRIDALALSHGHVDHWGGVLGFLDRHRASMRSPLPFYAGVDHFVHRWSERNTRRVDLGILHRRQLEAYDVDVRVVKTPTTIGEGLMLSGEMTEPMPFETIPASLRVEQDGQLVPDTFIGEQTLIANVRNRGLVVVTSCSHRGVIGICRWATRVAGVPKIHAVIGGFHLSGLGDERITAVVDAFRDLQVDYFVPQHCTGMEALLGLGRHLRDELVVSSVGSTFTFAA